MFRLRFLCMAVFAVSSAFNTVAAGEPYEAFCARCHDAGLHGAPLPRSAEMQTRLDLSGIDGLYKSILNGKARMPKRGGCFSCNDEQLLRALEEMLKPANEP